jgi:hypothetical protein
MIAVLDRRAGEQRLEPGLALAQRQPPQVAAVEIEQVERHHDEVVGLAGEAVL